MSGSVVIRNATAADAEILFSFFKALIQHHLPGQEPWTSAEQLRRDGFETEPLYEALIAELNGSPVGFVSFYRGYASWRGKPMGWINGLYVDKAARGSGVGRRLMASVARIAKERKWIRIELIVEEGEPAIDFYKALGLFDLHHRHFRLDGANLDALASSGFPCSDD